MKTPSYTAFTWLLCAAAVVGAGEQSTATSQESTEARVLLMEEDSLTQLKGEESLLLRRIAENRVPMPDAVLAPELPSLQGQLEKNLRFQLSIVQQQCRAGICSEERAQQIYRKLEQLGQETSPGSTINLNLSLDKQKEQTDSELTQHKLPSAQVEELMDLLPGLELEEQLLRIRIEGVRGFNITDRGLPYKKALKENLEQQLRLAEELEKAGTGAAHEPMLLKEKLESWCHTDSVLDQYLHHESEQVRHTAEQILHGTASWEDLLAEEERWLLDKITTIFRAGRTLFPEEDQLQKALAENLNRQNQLTSAHPSANQEQELSALRAQEKTLRARLTWFPSPEGDAADLVQQLRDNLRCRLYVAEQAVQQGQGSMDAITELKEKLSLCPKTNAEQDNSPADAELLKSHLNRLSDSHLAMMQYMMGAYKSGQCSILSVLEAEAQRLHILILGQGALHVERGANTPYIAQLLTNLSRQYDLATTKLESGVGNGADVLILREKLSCWFSRRPQTHSL